jgi:hypothetical protein
MRLILTGIVLFILSANICAQPGFNAGVIAGLNTAQINGDGHAGYDKFGFVAGLQTSIFISPKSELGLEFLYSQRGSQSKVIKGTAIPVERINLDYIEIPLVFKYNDWYFEELDYYKVRVEGGLSYGNLFRVKTSNTSAAFNDGDGFNKHDLSFLFGFAYQFNKHLAINFRYTRSITRLYTLELPGANYPYLIGYFLSFRTEYLF